jgi:hypothetical protein
MKYIIIGLLLSIGWHVVKLLYSVAEELIFCRLHDTDWYCVVAGKKTKNNDSKSNVVKNQIGFHYTEEKL